ncbi:winged helix DNA-binding protein [Streptomyces sp. Ag109_G2-6]|uniref:MarR family winged helix-turn-helix transcriptional regulator n=1 Tax=Streptomyces sp. Ag109_G2-6 TaxID=2485154 RepID=UPI000C2C46F9|nr:MarR family winged helix-turn-helix transcriptional regulator [Streptomyces sp. Ag109_G2-6]RPF25338.1 winged helix DNA-binding protein [Streptomyces sp. Ag109_G2-6]
MTTTAATTPTLNARVIALAHHAARTLAEGALTRHGITFHQSVTLRTVAVAGGTLSRQALLTEVTDALKTPAPQIAEVIDELKTAGLLQDHSHHDSPPTLTLTPTGHALYEATAAETSEIAARLYAGIPPEDLAVAGRVLTLITERANTELAD